MYIPKHYKGKDDTSAIAFMKRFNFATIITVNENIPIATHLPFVITGCDEAILLTSHFAKANEQWKNIESQEVLVIFTEPHAYISPTHYNKRQNVPTWNYLAVHAYGRAKIISEKEGVFNILEQMMDSFEPTYKAQWRSLPLEYKIRMANGIVAFEVAVHKLQFKEKLSQNKKQNERLNIITSLADSTQETDRMIAEYMRLNEQSPTNME